MGKQFGKFKTYEKVISKEALNNLHLEIDSLEDLSSYPDQTVAVLRKSDGEFFAGDVIVKKNGKWVKIEDLRNTLTKVTQFRGYKLGNRVYLRWKDPLNSTNFKGEILAKWIKTVIVRKYGTAPQNVNDGTIIVECTERNRFSSTSNPAFVDHIPDVDDEFRFYYKAFAYADNGTITTSDELPITEITWEDMSATIRDGRAAQLFAPGDVITLPNNFEIVVASIDTCRTTDAQLKNHPHLVTFMFRYSFGQFPFDQNKAQEDESKWFVLTRDTYALRNKMYYAVSTKSDKLIRVYPVVGSLLKPETYYEVVSRTRGENGLNNWMYSDIREWCNLESIDKHSKMMNEWANRTDNPETPLQFIKSLDPKLASIIVPTLVSTGQFPGDGSSLVSTSDLFFIPSITEITGKKNGTFNEGTQFQVFKDGIETTLQYEECVNAENQTDLRATSWWTRSAYQKAKEDIHGSKMMYINSSGEIGDTLANTTHGVILAFSIG